MHPITAHQPDEILPCDVGGLLRAPDGRAAMATGRLGIKRLCSYPREDRCCWLDPLFGDYFARRHGDYQTLLALEHGRLPGADPRLTEDREPVVLVDGHQARIHRGRQQVAVLPQ